jgi:CBS domain containing-hemolysin-like protein
VNILYSELLVAGAVVFVLLILNALFVAAEFSLVKLRYTRFNSESVHKAKEKAMVAKMLENLGLTLNVIRLGATICTVGLGFVLVPILLEVSNGDNLEQADGRLGLVLVLSFAIAVALRFTIGELVPRALALQHPVQTLKVSSWVVLLFGFCLSPFLSLLNFGTKCLLRLFRIELSDHTEVLDVEAQIRSLVSDGEELPLLAEKIMNNVIAMRKRVAQDILLPRNQIQYFDLQDSIEENLEIARASGHTRFPLCDGDLDNCVGVIHIKDMFRFRGNLAQIDLSKLKRNILRFSVDEPLENVLPLFLARRLHFALLVDEFGGTVGAITLENVLEELVGEIQDEFDKEEALIRSVSEDTFYIDGLAPVHDVSEAIGIEITSDEVSTFGGYISSELGQMPKLNETVRLGRLEIVVSRVDERRIISTLVTLLEEAEDDDENSEED